MQWVMDHFRYVLEVIKRSDDLAGFKVVPKRWIVERTFGWLLWSQRFNKDYEILPTTAEAFVYVAMIHDSALDADLLMPPKIFKQPLRRCSRTLSSLVGRIVDVEGQ
jgi:hypothetical protein